MPDPSFNPYRRSSEPTPEEDEAQLFRDLESRGRPYVPRAKTIKSIVKGWAIRRNITAEHSSLMTEQEWNAAVGQPLASYTRIGNLRRGVLHVFVDSPLVMQELSMRQSELVRTLQKSLPEHQIKSLKFKLSH